MDAELEKSLQDNWDRNEKTGTYEIVPWMTKSKHPELDKEGNGFPSETSDIKFRDIEEKVWMLYEDTTEEEVQAKKLDEARKAKEAKDQPEIQEGQEGAPF